MSEEQPTKMMRRGFAAMDPEKRREIARLGGKAVPAEKRSFSRDPDLAAACGRKGGSSIDPAKRTFSKDRALAMTAGRKGGIAPRLIGGRKEP
jgi:general stress protein YciG